MDDLNPFYRLDDYLLYSIPNLWSESEVKEKQNIAAEWDSIPIRTLPGAAYMKCNIFQRTPYLSFLTRLMLSKNA